MVSVRFEKIVFALIVMFGASPAYSSGVDLTLIYGSRYVGLGGQQIAIATDAYAPFYNPAGLAWIDKGSFVLNSSTLATQYGAPIGGADQQQKSDWGFAPLFYLGGTYRLTDRVSVGLGFYPTALQGGKFSNVDYSADIQDKEWSNRLVRFELSPSVGLKVIGPLSVGVSYRVGYTRFDNNSGNFGLGIYTDTSVSKWDAKGLKIGAMVEDFHNLSAALTYRFEQAMTLTGRTDLYNQGLGLTATPRNTPSSARLKIPAQLQAGVAYKIIPNKALVAFTYEFTMNDVIKTSNLVLTELNQTLPYPLNYRNGHTFHLGGEYQFDLKREDRHIKTQLGLAFDRSVTKTQNANPVLPPSDHFIGIAAGSQYHLRQHTFGIAANYGAYDSRTTTDIDPLLQGSIFPGKYSITNIMVSVDYQYEF